MDQRKPSLSWEGIDDFFSVRNNPATLLINAIIVRLIILFIPCRQIKLYYCSSLKVLIFPKLHAKNHSLPLPNCSLSPPMVDICPNMVLFSLNRHQCCTMILKPWREKYSYSKDYFHPHFCSQIRNIQENHLMLAPPHDPNSTISRIALDYFLRIGTNFLRCSSINSLMCK